jgi:hypothetical protein
MTTFSDFSSSPDNYTLGRGCLFFDNGTGERELGNAPEFNIGVDVDLIEHFSSKSGLRIKDKRVVNELTPTLSFILDEINRENVADAFLADIDSVVQVAGDASKLDQTAKCNRYQDQADEATQTHETDARDIGLRVLLHGAVTGGPFTLGETVTGGTSGATAVVLRVDSGQLVVDTPGGTPPFVDAETITGGTSSATAPVSVPVSPVAPLTAIGDGTFHDPRDVVVVDSATGLVFGVLGVDYEVKSRQGLIRILPTLAFVADGADVDVFWYQPASAYESIKGFAKTELEGFMRFVSDVPVGNNVEVKIWRANIILDGETAFIGEDFAQLSFTGEILGDPVGHPDNPFMEIIFQD